MRRSKRAFAILFTTLLVLIFGAQTALAESLTTTYNTNNSQSGNMFDVEVTSASGVVIDGFDVHLTGNDTILSVYYRDGSYVGAESSPDGWVLAGTQTVTPNGEGNPTPVSIGNIALSPGQQYGFYITALNDGYVLYTTGDNVYTDGNLTITTGIGKALPVFEGPNYIPRTWNGTIYYHIVSNTPGSGPNRIRRAEQAFWKPICELIATAEQDSVMEIDMQDFVRMPGYVMDALRAYPDVSLVLRHESGRDIIIPAGSAQPDKNISYYSVARLRELYS